MFKPIGICDEGGGRDVRSFVEMGSLVQTKNFLNLPNDI